MAASIDSALARYPSLAGKTVLITGGATGIGAAFVEHFFDQGAKVAFFDIDTDAGEALADQFGADLPDGRHRPMFLHVDLTDIDALRQGIADVRSAFGPIAVLVNNAANDKRHRIEDVTPESYDAGIAVNIRHQFFAAQAVIDDMKQLGGGSIINLGSISWMLKNGGYPVYVTAKAAVQGMTRGLARDLGPVQYPREYARARLGHDREATAAVARRRRPSRDQGRPVHRRRTAAGASRARGALSRLRRQPHDDRAGRDRRRRLGR